MPGKFNRRTLSLALLAIILLAAAAFAVSDLQKRQEAPPSEVLETPGPAPSPTPTEILQGRETYTIGQASDARPKIDRLVVNPHDPKVGETQTLEVRVADTSPVQSVEVSVTTDNGSANVPMTLVEGDNNRGTWRGSWQVNDTVLYRYVVTIRAVSADSESKVDVGIRTTAL